MKIEDVDKAIRLKERIHEATRILEHIEGSKSQKTPIRLVVRDSLLQTTIPTASLLDHVRAELGELQQQLEAL